jgi:hypothetical protein
VFLTGCHSIPEIPGIPLELDLDLQDLLDLLDLQLDLSQDLQPGSPLSRISSVISPITWSSVSSILKSNKVRDIDTL